MNINIKNINSIKHSNIEICKDGIQLIQTTAEARAMSAALTSISQPNRAIDREIEKFPDILPVEITREQIHQAIIQRNFEEEFYGQINSLFDDSTGEIVVTTDKDEEIKFTIKDNIVKAENLKPIRNNVIYLREYDPYDSHIGELLSTRGSVVDVLLNQDFFEHIFSKAGVSNFELQLNQHNQFEVYIPGIREPLHIKNMTKHKLPFLIMKHLVYNNSNMLINGILIVEQPHLSKKRLNLFDELLQLIQSKFGTAIYKVC